MIGTSYINNKIDELKTKFLNITDNKRKKHIIIISVSLICFSMLSVYFISRDERFYDKTIAKITSITETNKSKSDDFNGSDEADKEQIIKAVVKNGKYKGKKVQLQNPTSESQAYDIKLKVNDEVFVTIKEDPHTKNISADIIDFKRDNYIAYITILFVLLILLIGGIKGFRSLTSLVINIFIFFVTIELILLGKYLLLISAIASILFIIVSISIVSGINKKTLSAIIGTTAGTVISMLITAGVICLTHSNGIHYEEMEYIHPPDKIFFIEILIGTLGAIIDIAISISSSISEIYDKNPDADKKTLMKSGMEIGKDIMGTMANTLVFAYISGGIPSILLLFKNGFSFGYVINVNLSLEIIRALTGSIGIVLSIPITIYISVIVLKKQRDWRVLQ